ncbi:ABC transporter permease [Candidatus Leptofilum sp.]|uniref:ABC transporter permease n=1 Tax=Candidatus Leptofilum sp. TaxID=3241576 RepID=UPI003B5A0280
MKWGFPTGLRAGWRWFRSLNENPVYLREKGGWGNPNPYYEKLRRYSPFVVMGAIVLGLCAGTNPALLGATEDDELFNFICLVCLPGGMLSMLTIYGSFMAPALTAPTISMEVNRGTWDILRLTPHATSSILLAKLFGGLARLNIWKVMLVLSFFQALMLLLVITVVPSEATAVSSLLIGLGAWLRPWVEVLFAAFIGMYLSTWARSSTFALAASYVSVVLMKLFNSSLIWLGVWNLFNADTLLSVGGSMFSPTAVYGTAVLLLWWGIVRQARKLSN